MPDSLLSLLVAKAKSVGLVAGTALATTALVGGGAVAVTAVSHEGELHEAPVLEQIEQIEDTGSTSDSPTVGIKPPAEEDEAKTPPVLPSDFTCDETVNHGQNVSTYARSLPKGPGRGEKVSAVAQSDCGKTAGDEAELEVAEADEPKADKPAKDKPAKPAKAERPGKGKPAGVGGKGTHKSGGKGGGKR